VGCFFAPRCEFAIERCRVELPARHEIADRRASDPRRAHWSRCHRAEEVVELPPLGELPLRAREPLRSGEPLLAIENVSAGYGEKAILDGVSTAAHPQRCLAIVGESGAGKSTLARCIVGLHAHWTGSIRFDGVELSRDRRRRTREEIKSLQYVFQNPYTSLNPRKTVGQLVEQPLRELFNLSRAERGQRVGTALHDAALNDEYRRRYPDQLSGGERQRVALARALVLEPKLLVCDEVTSALDVSVQATIVELLHRLKLERGLALVLITHNLALVRSLADDVVILRDGCVAEQGHEVINDPKSEYGLQLLADIPTLSPDLYGSSAVASPPPQS
jgi:peptide/nickel transport system ATP-binding protein